MTLNRGLAFLISMIMLVGMLPVSALAADPAGDRVSMEAEVSDPCADGHDYKETVTKPATETDEGEVTYTCTRCGDEYKEAIPKLEKEADKQDDSRKEEDKKAEDKKEDKKASSCKVTLPSGKGYTITAKGDTSVAAGGSFSFSLKIAEGYRKGKDFSVKAGGTALKESSNGTYTIKNVKKDVKVTVSGVEKIKDKDQASPAQAPEKDSGSKDAENGAASAADVPAAPADVEPVTDEPVNSGESKYDLYVDGKAVTEDNKGDILGEEDDEDGEVRKTAVYDDKTNTLTLDEATLSNERPGPAVRYDGTADFTISFKGHCFLVGQPDEDVGDGVTAYGISATNGSLLLKACGEGVMIITNKDAITGKDVSFDEELCLGDSPEVYVIPGGHGLVGDDMGVSIASSHQWGPLDYEWSDDYSTCTATKCCSNNVDHKETEEGKVTIEVLEPTSTEPGKTVYTATFEDEVFEDQVVEFEDPDKPAIGYGLFVEGVNVTEENYKDVLGDNTAIYDPDQKILTLQDAVIFCESGPAIRYTGDEELTIEFKGSNTLTGAAKKGVGDDVTAYGIFVGDGSLVIKADGAGELRITNEEAIAGRDISLDEKLCLGPEGVYVIPGGTGFSCESGIVIASSHDWKQPVYSWADDYSKVSAECVCKNNKGHMEQETVATTKKATKEATCEAAGESTYTAVFESDAFTKQTKTVKTAALGHQWGSPVFSWSDGNTQASATFTCKRDPGHTKTVKASVKKEITLPAVNEDGKITYTASVNINGKTISETKETVIEPAGTAGYKFTAQTYSWTKGTKNPLNLTVKRNEFDEITYSAFLEITVDGKTVKSSGYETEKGSLKLALKKDYLQKLAAGTHTLKVQFRDGRAETKFTVKGTSGGSSSNSKSSRSSTRKTGSSPRTGDDTNAALWIGILIVAVLGIAGVLIYRKRDKTKK